MKVLSLIKKELHCSMKTTKKITELEQEIKSLNWLLAEYKDQINALANERDKYKFVLEQLVRKYNKKKGAKNLDMPSLPEIVENSCGC